MNLNFTAANWRSKMSIFADTSIAYPIRFSAIWSVRLFSCVISFFQSLSFKHLRFLFILSKCHFRYQPSGLMFLGWRCSVHRAPTLTWVSDPGVHICQLISTLHMDTGMLVIVQYSSWITLHCTNQILNSPHFSVTGSLTGFVYFVAGRFLGSECPCVIARTTETWLFLKTNIILLIDKMMNEFLLKF